MNRKKAQIKFGETFGVIIIVYLVVMVGMIWYNGYMKKDIAKMSEDNRIDQSFEKYYYVVNNNMLHLSQLGDIDEEFDLMSLRVFENYSKSEVGRERVRKQLGESIVTVEVFEFDIVQASSPSGTFYNFLENVIVYNNTPVDEDGKPNYKNREAFRSLIPVVDTIEKETYLGVLTVYVFD